MTIGQPTQEAVIVTEADREAYARKLDRRYGPRNWLAGEVRAGKRDRDNDVQMLARRADEAVKAEREWRTIDSREWAEGDEALVFNDRGVFAAVFDATWGDGPDYGYRGGWWMVSDGKDCERPLRGDTPTHWKPLPAGPAIRNHTTGERA